MKKMLFLSVLMIALFSKSDAQLPTANPIRKVSAKEVKAMIDNSTGPTIINFWATWCAPCIHEIPWFDSIIARKNSPVKLLLVSLDYKSAYPFELTAFVRKHGYKGEVVYLDDTNIDSYIKVIDPKWKGAIPASIFVDNTKKYYQLYNEQIPKQRFEMELDKLMVSK